MFIAGFDYALLLIPEWQSSALPGKIPFRMAKRNIVIRLGAVLFPLALCLYGQLSSQQLISRDPSLRQTALRQLAMLSAQQKSGYVPELVRLLRSKEAYNVVLAFAKIGPSAIPVLVPLLDDPDRGVRGFAATALATIRPISPESINKLRLMLKDKDSWVQRRVAASLLGIGISDEGAQSMVLKPVDFPPIGPTPGGTVPDWIQSLSSDSPVAVYNAVYYLKSAGQSAVPALIEALKNENPDIRAGAAQVLARMNFFRSDIEAACIQALVDPSARVREFARHFLRLQATEAAMDALLQDEIAEIARKRAIERRAQIEKTLPHSRAGILAPISSDPDNKYPLEATEQFETKAPDGTVLFTVLHTGKERGDLLRIWRFRQGGYYLVKEDKTAEPDGNLSAGGFRYQGKAYLHVSRVWKGTRYQHEDEFFRIESGGLVKLESPEGLPLKLAPGEGVWKGFVESFKDDKLEFRFGIWNEGDANCCPTAGWVQGTYTIVGDVLKYATWNRSNDIPR
jgi:HEAT repeat protein